MDTQKKVSDTDRARALMDKIDEAARLYDHKEYGLPVYDKAFIEEMCGIAAAAFAEVREECARVAVNEIMGRVSVQYRIAYAALADAVDAAIRANKGGV